MSRLLKVKDERYGNRLTKIGILIVVSHLLLIFFSVLNQILVIHKEGTELVKRVITDKA
jgi:hypothetical protein